MRQWRSAGSGWEGPWEELKGLASILGSLSHGVAVRTGEWDPCGPRFKIQFCHLVEWPRESHLSSVCLSSAKSRPGDLSACSLSGRWFQDTEMRVWSKWDSEGRKANTGTLMCSCCHGQLDSVSLGTLWEALWNAPQNHSIWGWGGINFLGGWRLPWQGVTWCPPHPFLVHRCLRKPSGKEADRSRTLSGGTFMLEATTLAKLLREGVRGCEAGINTVYHYLFESLFSYLKSRKNMTYLEGSNGVKYLTVPNYMSNT